MGCANVPGNPTPPRASMGPTARGSGLGTQSSTRGTSRRMSADLRRALVSVAKERSDGPQGQSQAAKSASATLDAARAQIKQAASKTAIDSAVRKAEAAVKDARRRGASPKEVARLEGGLKQVRDEARRRSNALGVTSARNLAAGGAAFQAASARRAALRKGNSESATPRAKNAHKQDRDVTGSDVDYSAAANQARAEDGSIDADAFIEALSGAWEADYREATGGAADLTRSEDHGFTFVFDHSKARVVAGWGVSRKPEGARDDYHQQRAPKPVLPTDEKFHLFGHALGGGLDINMIPGARVVNRGEGSGFAKLERYAIQNPGTYCFVRLVYDDDSQRPSEIESGLMKPEGPEGKQFHNYGD
jgi:hypothetical protein